MLVDNPFSVQTPENMTAEDIYELFVPIGDFHNLERTGHVFVHGHRGSGKSMMFRRMSPDCQILVKKCSLEELPYYGVYLSIKATDLNLPEFQRLNGQAAGYILSEHMLVSYLISKTIQSLIENCASIIDQRKAIEELIKFSEDVILKRMRSAGFSDLPKLSDLSQANQFLNGLLDLFDTVHAGVVSYLRKLTFSQQVVPYEGGLLGFHDFLLPVLTGFMGLSFMPKGPVFLLIDDADNLNHQQTQILNTWVSYRTTKNLSLKISTQLNYKTYLTSNGQRIESPHDYSEVNVSSIYTGPQKDNYPDWVGSIVTKRLEKYSIHRSAEEFFPPDANQEEQIRKIADEYKEIWAASEKGGYRAGDDAYRYARPEFIKRLLGKSKQGSTYKYAGFKQLVHLSSGIIRYFLESASKMYSEQKRHSDGKQIDEITPTIQDKIVREQADDLLFSQFDKILDDVQQQSDGQPEQVQKMRQLRNLIMTMGALFQHILLSDRSERRVFSFAISDEPSTELKSILQLGVQHGYFYEASIGTKEGMGRTRLYVMTRRLAPFFKLDPMGFSGYKFVTSSFLLSAATMPKQVQSKLEKMDLSGIIGQGQLLLDFSGDAE